MNISSSHRKIKDVRVTQRTQRPIDSIEKAVSREVTCGLVPLSFQKSPESFRYVLLIGKVAGINREIVDRVAILVTLYNLVVTLPVCLHPLYRRLVVGNRVAHGLK